MRVFRVLRICFDTVALCCLGGWRKKWKEQNEARYLYTSQSPVPSSPQSPNPGKPAIAEQQPPNDIDAAPLITPLPIPTPPTTFDMFGLPLVAQMLILRFLLVSSNSLILHRDESTPSNYSTDLSPAILRASRHFYQIGRQILYRENTFTTSSPATSYNFDAHIAALRGPCRKLITNVALQIDWGDQLWSKFPLIAVRLGELKLKKLTLEIVKKNLEKERPALREISHNQSVSGAGQGSRGVAKREGTAALVMLKAEKKMLRDLVDGLPALREFKLKGFRDENFGRELEEAVNRGRRVE